MALFTAYDAYSYTFTADGYVFSITVGACDETALQGPIIDAMLGAVPGAVAGHGLSNVKFTRNYGAAEVVTP